MSNDLLNRRALVRVLLLTLLFETVTAFCRFGLDFEATRDTRELLAPLTANLRIHHCYIGLLMLPFAALLHKARPAPAAWILQIGCALILSDLVHHFIVLYSVVGSPEFDLVYS